MYIFLYVQFFVKKAKVSLKAIFYYKQSVNSYDIKLVSRSSFYKMRIKSQNLGILYKCYKAYKDDIDSKHRSSRNHGEQRKTKN